MNGCRLFRETQALCWTWYVQTRENWSEMWSLGPVMTYMSLWDLVGCTWECWGSGKCHCKDTQLSLRGLVIRGGSWELEESECQPSLQEAYICRTTGQSSASPQSPRKMTNVASAASSLLGFMRKSVAQQREAVRPLYHNCLRPHLECYAHSWACQ